MEKLSNVPGILVSGNKPLDMLHLKHELEKKKKLYNSVNLSRLPDNGARIKNQIDELEEVLKSLSLESNDGKKSSSPLNSLQDNNGDVSEFKNDTVARSKKKPNGESGHEESKNVKPVNNTLVSKQLGVSGKNVLSFKDLTPKQDVKDVSKNVMDSPSFKSWRDPKNERKALLTEPKPLIEKVVPKNNAQYHFTTNHYLQTNDECAKKMHNLLITYPDDSKEEAEPENLRSSLMMHQKNGLAWLMWREQQDPSGGILADDMGLGKTLTMISLILKQKEICNYSSFKEDEYECRGTLIVCVASVIHQWGDEINKHCENDALKVYLYHGPQRDKSFKRMMDYDVVLTTYNIVMVEKKATDNTDIKSPLFKLKWERIILDEAHTIKNYTSHTAQAIFCLRSFRRWAVTGTPIHNVFKDVYSLVKFLRFSPFDDCKKFKELTDDNSELNAQRRNLLIKSVVLRRTKAQVDEWGKPLIEMRKKSISICYIELSAEERHIYEKLNEKISKKFNQFFEKSPSKLSKSNGSLVLVLLLQLQQCCNHISLLTNKTEEPDDPNDIADILSSLTINDTSSNSDSLNSSINLTFDEGVTDELNDPKVKSSKIKELFKKLHEISESSKTKDKSVIVSQWVSMLEIVEYHLKQENIAYHKIAGKTKVEDRQKFADDFNYNKDGAKVMLLSLRAGGVGLNLIGANHLFLLDLHWNPALEMQACDRIHRVGQDKDVVIHKFICKNTIEEKIKALQDKKSDIASSALRGTKQNTSGLTIEELKMLFSVRK